MSLPRFISWARGRKASSRKSISGSEKAGLPLPMIMGATIT